MNNAHITYEYEKKAHSPVCEAIDLLESSDPGSRMSPVCEPMDFLDCMIDEAGTIDVFFTRPVTDCTIATPEGIWIVAIAFGDISILL